MTPQGLLPRLIAVGLLVATGSVACKELAGGCDFTIAGVAPGDSLPAVGARLRDDAAVVVTRSDVDWGRSFSGTDVTGQPSITLRLRPEAAASFARYTATHINESLAIAVDGEILAVPTVNAEIEGDIEISGPPEFIDLEPLRACLADG